MTRLFLRDVWGTMVHLPLLTAIAALTWVPIYVLQTVAALALGVSSRMPMVTEALRDGREPDGWAVAALGLYAAVCLVIVLVAVPIGQGALIAALGLLRAGSPVRISECYRTAVRKAPAFLGAMAVVALVVVLGESALYVIGITVAAVTGTSALMLTLMIFAASVGPLFIAVPFAVAPQAVVLEDLSAINALRRSRALLRGHYWPALAVLILLGLIGWLAGVVLGLPVRYAGLGSASILAGAAAGVAGSIVLSPLVISVLTAVYFATGGSGSAERVAGHAGGIRRPQPD